MPISDRLQLIAARLGKLTPQHKELTTPLNFALGAIHALKMARALDYDGGAEDGRGWRMWQLACGIGKDVSHGEELPVKGEWLAGYYFNDGIIRIAVSFEHMVRHVTNKPRGGNIDTLIEAAIPLGFQETWGNAWRPMQNELNAIRHRNEFIDGPRPEVDYPFVVDALEKLIEALTWGLQLSPHQRSTR